MTDERLLTQFWRRAVTAIIGLGMVGLGLFLLSVGMNPECDESDLSGLLYLCIPYDGTNRHLYHHVFTVPSMASILLVIGPILALLGTPVVLAAVRRPGSIPPLVVAGCITLLPGIHFVFAAATGEALSALISFVASGVMFTVVYLSAPREVSK